MRNTNSILFQVLLCLFCSGLSAGNPPDSVQQTFDSKAIDSFKLVNDVYGYFNRLSDIAIDFTSKGISIDLKTLEEAFQWIPEVASKKDSLQIRYSMTSMAFMFYKRYGNYQKALGYYLRANKFLSDKIGGDKYSWFIENEIASIYTRLGNFEKALIYYEVSENYLQRTKDYRRLSQLYTNLGRMYRSWGKIGKAVDFFELGLSLVDESHKGYVSNHINLAEMYIVVGDEVLAEKHLKLVDKALIEITSERHLQIIEAEADLAFLKQSFIQAESLYSECVKLFLKQNENSYRREFAKLCNKVAINAIQLENFNKAASHIALGLHSLNRGLNPEKLEIPDQDQIYPENSFIELLITMSELVERRNRKLTESVLDSIININQLGIYVNESLRRRYVMMGSQLYAVNFNRELLDKLVDFYYEKQKNHSVDLEEVADLFAMSKAVLLEEEQNLKACILELPDSLHAKYESIYDSLFFFQSKVSFEPSDSIKLVYERKMVELREELDALSDCNFRETRRRIEGNFIDYYVGEKNVYSLSQTNEGLFFSLHGATDTLIEMVNVYNTNINDRLIINPDVNCELYNFLLSPVEEVIDNKLCIIPDGILLTVPFETLSCNTTQEHLSKIKISYKYNTKWKSSIEKSGDIRLAYISPSYSYTQIGLVQRKNGRGLIYNELPFAKEEIKRIKSIVGGKPLEIHSIEDYFMNEASTGEYNVLHYAGHATTDGNEAFLQYGVEELDRIHFEQIHALNLDLDLVVLSACSSGLGSIQRGEGLMSLGRSFLSAGSDAVVYSLWNVNDQTTSEVISYFYKFLKKGYNKSSAMRSAKLQYLKSVPPERRHPYHWAGFVVVGNDDPIIKKSMYKRVMYVLLIAAAILLVLKSTKRK